VHNGRKRGGLSTAANDIGAGSAQVVSGGHPMESSAYILQNNDNDNTLLIAGRAQESPSIWLVPQNL
jgi:hypothetical protein